MLYIIVNPHAEIKTVRLYFSEVVAKSAEQHSLTGTFQLMYLSEIILHADAEPRLAFVCGFTHRNITDLDIWRPLLINIIRYF